VSQRSSPHGGVSADAFDDVPLGDFVRRRVESLLTTLSGAPVEGLYPVVMREVERTLLSAVLAHTHGRRADAARILGLHRNSLRHRLSALGLSSPRKRRTKTTKR
jgi:DNA-binding protein Fis